MTKAKLKNLLTEAIRHYKAGRIKKACKSLEIIFKADEWHAEGLLLVAHIADQLGYYSISSKLLNAKMQDRAPNPFIYQQLGKYLATKGDNEQAIKAQQKVIAVNPKNVDAHYYLALILLSQGQFSAAIDTCNNGLKQKSLHYRLYIPYIRALTETRQYEEALNASNKLIKIKPNFFEAYFQKAGVLLSMGRLSDSALACRKAIKLNPTDARCYSNLGYILKELFELDDAEKMFQAAIRINPLEHVAHSNYLYLLTSRQLCTADKLTAELNKWSATHCDEYRKHQLLNSPKTVPLGAENGKKLKVGYVSYDFRKHPVAQFFEPLIKNHNKDVVETYCYANHPSHLTDTTTERINTYADHWRSVEKLSDQALAQLIHDDGIQVLVDLGGHTGGNRLKVFAFRPAPVQVTYLGFFGSTGVQEMDYWITDQVLHPTATKELSREALYRLDRCWVSYEPPSEMVKVERVNKNAEEIVFGCFSATLKFSKEMLTAWCTILRSQPHSKLLLLSKSYSESSVREKLLQYFEEEKITSDRIQFKAQVSYAEYIKMYTEVDVILDTFPRSGGTTTADALWMGVPVVTLAGGTYVSRISAAKLYAINKKEWVAVSVGEYIQKAIHLASDDCELEKNRLRLRDEMLKSELCDGLSLAQTMERAYKDMFLSC